MRGTSARNLARVVTCKTPRSPRLRGVLGGLGWGLLACVLATAPGCKKKSRVRPEARNADPMALIPEGVGMLVNVNVPAVLGGAAYKENQAKVEESELAPALAALRACKLGPAALQRVSFGFDDKGNRVIVLRGKDIGTQERWTCLAKQPNPGIWPAFEVYEDAKADEVRLRPTSGAGARGLLVDGQTVLLSDAFWWPKVQALVSGKAKPAIETQLRSLYANAPTHRQIWFRGELPAQAKVRLGRFAPSSDSGLERVSGGVDLKAGLELEFDGIFASAQLAQNAKRELSSWLEHLRASSPMFGLPKEVMQRASLDVEATLLRFRVDIQAEEWKVFQRNLSRISAGSRKAPKIPDMFPRVPVSSDLLKEPEKVGKKAP